VGKLEKLVVLTVLFLVAVILGVSLNSDEGAADAMESPLSVARAAGKTSGAGPGPDGAEPAPLGASSEPGARPIGPRRTLSVNFPTEPAARTAAAPASVEATPAPTPEPELAAVAEPEPYVVTTLGLQPSLSEDVMLYTWKQGDSFSQLAETYYGSSSRVYRLQRANEGRAEAGLRAGQQILVPVLPDSAPEPEPEAGRVAWAGGSTYTVASGDVLGTISEAIYGTSQSWRKIFDANRDKLADPNHLEVGMVLRIPE
jgi:nucleoid-associated protein YgaU